MPSNEAAFLRLQAARIVAQMRWPYLSTLIFTLPLIEVGADELSTMAVDSSWRLYYNPEFVLAEDADALATVLLHECMHCMLAHAPRYKALGASGSWKVWNIAGDCSINAIIDESKMPWTSSVTPVRIKDFTSLGLTAGMTTEGMYLLLLENATELFVNVDCGSALDGKVRVYESAPDDADNPGLSHERQGILLDRLASEITAHQRSQSDVPAGLLRWAEEHLDARIDWRRLLGVRIRTAIANEAGRRDYSYVRPSRRQHGLNQQGLNVVLPSMRQPRPPSIAVVVDTSGSIGANEIKQFIGEVAGIARAVGVSQGLWVVPCDSEPGSIQRLRSISAVDSLKLHGGGDTDMRVGIAATLNIQPTPQVIVVLTDGFTPWPTEKPRRLQHAIAVLSENFAASEVPSWMTTIVMSLEDMSRK